MVRLGVLCILVFFSCSSWAAVVTHAEVVRKGKVFYLDSTLELNAAREDMFELLTNYDRMQHFSSGFVESKHFPPDEKGDTKVYLHLKGCVTFFCRHVKKMEKLETQGQELITTTLIPEESYNVRRIESSWELSDIQIPVLDGVVLPSATVIDKDKAGQVIYSTGTKIRYRMVFQPGFWVPPVIGGYLVKKALVSDGTDILNRMERYAQSQLQEKQEMPTVLKSDTE